MSNETEDYGNPILAALEAKLDTIHADLEKLHSQAEYTVVDAITFDTADEAYTSDSVDISDYRDFDLLIDLAVTGAPTDIVIRFQLSDDDVTFYDLMNGPFGDLRYEDGAGDKQEAISGKIMSNYGRLYVLSSGCDASNKFTLTAKAIVGK